MTAPNLFASVMPARLRRRCRTLLLPALILGAWLRLAAAADEADAARRWAAAARAYAADQAPAAAAGFRRILSDGWTGPELLYNLGVASLAAGDAPQAILNFRRAWRLAPRDADLQRGLESALQAARLTREPMPFTDAVRSACSATEWRNIEMVSWWLLLTIAALRLAAWLTGRLFARALALAACCWLISLGGLQFWRARLQEREAVVIAPAVQARLAPSAAAQTLGDVPPGTLVRQTEFNGAWARIRWQDRSGWIPLGALEPVALPENGN